MEIRGTALLWRKRHSTWYNISLHNTLLSLYNRHYKHSDNFKEIIFGKLKKATSPHHWLGILPKKVHQRLAESEFLWYLRIPQKCPTKKNQVFDHCVLLCFNVDEKDPFLSKNWEWTIDLPWPEFQVLDIPSSLVAEFFQQKRHLGLGR